MKFLWWAAGIVICVVFLAPVVSLDYQRHIIAWLAAYPYAAPLIVIGVRLLTMIIAPLPGLPLSLASMAVLPWQQAFLYNLIGVEIGSAAAFLIARRFREPIVSRLAPLQSLNEWHARISGRMQFGAFLFVRLLSASAFDFASYAAGLTRLPFSTFLLASFIVDASTSFLFYYLGSRAMQYGIYIFFGFAAILIAGAVLARLLWNKN
jgi:uncharacterized membrane protein YdjX (TVP38/TMEM64 family)